MINAIKRGFGYSIGKYIFFFIVAIVIALLSYLLKFDFINLLSVHALEPDNSIIATQWNKYYKNSTSTPSTSTYFYANKTYLWSEQYSKFNWYMWETDFQMSDRLELFKDYITSRSWTDISDNNNIQFVISCGATFTNNQVHNKDTLISGACYIYPIVNGAGNMAVNETIHRIEGTQTETTSNSTYVNIYNLYSMSIPSNNQNIFIEFSRQANNTNYYSYFNLTDAFFTTPLEDLDTLFPTLNFRVRKNVSSGSGMPLFSSRIYYQSVPKYNGILNTYYPFDTFLYQSDITPTFDTSDHTYYTLSNESITEKHCHIINGSNTCSEDFTFTDYYTYINSGGDITQNENGNVDVTPSGNSNVDYTSNINAINSNITDPNIDTSGFPLLDDDESKFLPSQFIDTLINFINSLSNSTCSPLTSTLLGQSVTIPCISTVMWTHVPTLSAIYQILVGGLICYWLYIYNFKTINNALDPLSDKIEVVEL